MATSPPNTELGIARLCAVCCKAASFQDNHEAFEENLDDDGLPHLVFPQEYNTSERQLIRTDTLPDLPRLDDSSHRGCDFCGFLRGIIRSTDTKDVLRQTIGKSLNSIETRDISIYVSYLWKGEGDSYRCDGVIGLLVHLDFNDIEVRLNLLCLAEGIPGAESTMRWLGLAIPTSQSYLNEHNIEWMVKCLGNCIEHEHESVDEDFIPDRLVDVRGPTPQLVLRRDLLASIAGFKTPIYTALSYCWGSPQDAESQLKTTTGSIARRQAGITDHEMTAVLRDAVAVTRALSIPYLWVDALCVLQDDESDWQLQCMSMSKIYYNARVTLCAASSTSCHQGFLSQRGNRIRIPFRSTRRSTITGSYFLQFKYADKDGLEFFGRHGELHEDLHSGRWNNRGWVFQEQYSSKRRLLFGNTNVHFFCDRSHATMGASMLETPYFNQLFMSRGKSKVELYEMWEEVLLNYSKIGPDAFSQAKDILPALSGLARHYNENLQDVYLSGFWKANLLRHLMWYRSDDALPSRPAYLASLLQSSQMYLTPSWSSIGVGRSEGIGNLERVYSHLRLESEYLDGETNLAGRNQFVAIKNGQLHIRSHVIDLVSLGGAKLSIDTIIGATGLLRYGGKHVGQFHLDFAYTSCRCDCHGDEEASISDDIDSFSWVLLGSCKVRHVDEPETRARRSRGAFGLILYPVPNSNKFHRVGTFFPDLPKKHGEGLRLFKDMGKVRTVVVI